VITEIIICVKVVMNVRECDNATNAATIEVVRTDVISIIVYTYVVARMRINPTESLALVAIIESRRRKNGKQASARSVPVFAMF
jgi:hypothetical protein